MQANVLVAIPLIFTALLVIAICVPLLKGHVGMNAVYGMRLPRAFKSDDAWYAINRYGAKRFIVWSLVMIAIAIVSILVPFAATDTIAMVFLLTPLVYGIAAVETYLYSRRF